ncbi:MAG: type II secretion system protein GspG [Robiginitomaculum sp.]|nr:MAG: type II secretion system protein GspG [Robiginitomaculum sp.]PHS40797.1 MAG: type II secretion system protein GspG [Robiginitomaculum sp.]
MDVKKRQKQAGFTLVEVMVTMVIIGMLATIVVINVLPMMSKAKGEKARIDISRLSQALEYYNLDTNSFPENLEELLNGQSSSDERARPEGYIQALPDDPWGNPYLYAYPGENGRFDIWSYGADGEEGGEGNDADITSWQN